MQTVVDHIVPMNCTLLDYGQMDTNVKHQLKGYSHEYEHIAVLDFWYDDENDPYGLCWIGVEGMGFGWAWMDYEKEDWHDMMTVMVADRAKELLENSPNVLYFEYASDTELTCHFVILSEEDPTFRHDVVITFSHYKLYAEDLM